LARARGDVADDHRDHCEVDLRTPSNEG
jgi:hypothetical protein